jgi:hypothetical protein
MKVDFLVSERYGLAPALKGGFLHTQDLCVEGTAGFNIFNG